MTQQPQRTIELPASFLEGTNGEIISVALAKPVARIIPDSLTSTDYAALTRVIIQALTMAFPTPETRQALEEAQAGLRPEQAPIPDEDTFSEVGASFHPDEVRYEDEVLDDDETVITQHLMDGTERSVKVRKPN